MDHSTKSPHTFHIPVMGTGFSIDTPLKVAKYGISSVVSLVDDVLIEQMRRFHCERLGMPYVEIPDSDEDPRANRITAYLELLSEVVRGQVRALQSSPFESGSEITRYFEMLPEAPLKRSYLEMLTISDPIQKTKLQDTLRSQAVPGSIDVNIMTKLDRNIYHGGKKLPPEFADAMAALRGYARSGLRSSIIFSAGINRRLFSYLAKFDDFLPDDRGILRKKIVLKVSDFRSAMIQGRYLAKRGLWVSEFRIESGLNCGGHAFPSEGYLMGPILDEFRRHKTELIDDHHEIYNRALAAMERLQVQSPHEVRITVQGGIGTADENRFLLQHFRVEGTGWGTPFLLVPEVTNVDDGHLEKLSAAGDSDVYLSDRSPLGVPFWILRNCGSEELHRRRIDTGKPGSPCPKGYLAANTEFTEVSICQASRLYQNRKLRQLSESDHPTDQLSALRERVLAKSCICHGVGGGATLKLGIDPKANPAICSGPNIANFSKVASLEEMVSHIYGRLSLLSSSDRPHMFISELSIYVDYFRQEVQEASEGLVDRTAKYFREFKHNLITGIDYYRNLAEQFSVEQKERFLSELDTLFSEIEDALPGTSAVISIESAT
ncbi:MAG: hypothetical protein KAW46_05605 [candidate division Zixibacteria bacterium]|nr:hypothetical protein [candidate division Zixibacteria bacterium]